MEKPGSHCVIQRMAKAIMEDPSLKAVWLDARRRKISFAFQPGADSEAAKKRLQQLAGERSPLEFKDCAENPWRRVCQHCEFGSKEPMPAGIRMLSMPDAGVLLEKETCPTAPRFWKWKEFRWVRLRPRVPAVESPEPSGYRRELAMALACGAAGGMGFFSERWLSPGLGSAAAPVLYGLAYLSGAWHPAREVWELLRKRILDIHFLMLCVAAGAACIGHWWEGAMLLFLFSLSGALEEMALARTEREIKSLFKESPKEAAVLDEQGGERRVAVEELKPGMTMVVRPDELFAADAEVVEGATAVNESSLTGESEPVEKSRGDTVYSGTLNLWGAVRCRVEKTAGESALAKVIRLIQEAQESKAPSQRFTDRFGTRYTYGILFFSFAMFLVWRGMGVPAFHSDGEESSAFYRAMTLLVVASPCALVLSIPSAVLAGIASGARKGILFRGGAAIENLADAKRIVFDKTGTLTTGVLEVVRVESFPPGKEDEVLEAAAAIGSLSKHPVSQAVSKAYLHAGRSFPGVDRLRSVEGMGLTARIQSPSEEWLEVVMGRRLIFQEEDWLRSVPDPGDGLTEILVRRGDVKGRILLRDQVRSSSRELVQRIRRAGLKVTMLTGDRLESARVVADALGLDDFKAELRPEDKVRMIQKWQELGERPVMIGDGVNDAPSLAAAQVGVAMGMRGSDAALEQADIVLMKDRLENFYHAYRLSLRARTIIRQNLAVSLGMVIVLVLGALGSALPLTLGVIGHEGSTVVVVFNSLRLLFFKPSDLKYSPAL